MRAPDIVQNHDSTRINPVGAIASRGLNNCTTLASSIATRSAREGWTTHSLASASGWCADSVQWAAAFQTFKRSACANSAAVKNRSAGERARHLRQMASSSGATSGRHFRNDRRGDVSNMLCSNSVTEIPENGACPTSIENRTAPRPNTSVRDPIGPQDGSSLYEAHHGCEAGVPREDATRRIT